MELTIVIPTYNEVENLPKLAADLFALPLSPRLLIVDDSSPDGTGRVAEEMAASYEGRLSILHRPHKMGLGSAYIKGFTEALHNGAEVVAQMDADFSHPPEKLLALYEALQNCDVAMGSRYVPGGSVDKHWSFWRKWLSSFGNYYARLILGLPVRDLTGGFRMWRRETLLGIPLNRVRSNGYAFQIEMAYVAYRLGFKFQEIPFYFVDRHGGQSKMSFHIQREAAIRVWQIRFEYRHLTHPEAKKP
jgi:dolichol-phosphate mannosyltransferase